MSVRGQLEIVNFRSHPHSILHFDGRPLVITGPNGAGKTNLLEAFSLFSPGRGLRRSSPGEFARRPLAQNPDEENPHAPNSGGPTGGGAGWKSKLTLEGALGALPAGGEEAGEKRYEEGQNAPDIIENIARIDERRQVLINGKAAAQTMMARFIRPIWMVPAHDRIWGESASERRQFYDRIVLSLFPEHGTHVLGFEKQLRERNRLLREGVVDAHWYAALEEGMEEAALKISKTREEARLLLERELAAQEGVFPRAGLTLENGDGEGMREGWAEFWRKSRSADLQAGTTRFGPHRLEFSAIYHARGEPASRCSTGEQKALLISLFLANARALGRKLSGDANPLQGTSRAPHIFLLLDEVIAHLDEARRGALFDELNTLDAQIMMSGTDAGLFSGLKGKARMIEIALEGDASQIREGGQL